MPTSENILIKAAPVASFDRASAALNVVGASTSASRGLLDSNTANYIYVNTSTGNDTTGTGAVGAPYKTLTKAYSVWSSGKVVHVVNSDAITLGSGAETTTSIDRATQAAVGVAPVMTLSTAWTATTAATAELTDSGRAIAVACDGTRYVLIGGAVSGVATRIQSSTDGNTWTTRTKSASITYLFSLAYGGGRFIIGGDAGKCSYSTDGATWTDIPAATGWTTSPTGGNCYSVVYGHAGWAVGGGRKIQKSTNGTSMELCTIQGLPTTGSWFFYNAVYANGTYYFYSSDGVVTSSDLTSFTVYDGSASGNVSTNNAIAYGNGIFLNVYGKYSYDGIDFTQGTAPSLFGGTVQAFGISFGAGVFVVTDGANIHYTKNSGTSWTAVDVTGSTGSACKVGFGHLGFITGADEENFSSTTIKRFKAGPLLKGSLCGFDLTTDGAYIASTNAAVTVLNCDADYGIDAVKDSNGFSVKNSVVRNIRASENIMAELSETVVTGNVELFKNYASTNDVNKNTIVGRYSDWDTTTTDIDQFRDNIIGNGIRTNRVLTVDSGNTQGGVSPSVTNASGLTYAVDPLYIDASAGDYRLRRKGDGFTVDSPLLGLSTFYTYTGSDAATYDRDFGAYSFDASYATEEWTRAILLPRPSIQFLHRPRATYLRTNAGKVQGWNRKAATTEGIGLSWDNIDNDDWELVRELFLDFESVRVYFYFDAAYQSGGTVTVNGNQSAGVSVLEVDSTTNAPAGSVVTIGGADYRVMRATATRLILSTELATGVSDNDVLTVKQVPVSSTYDGEYIMRYPEGGWRLTGIDNSNDTAGWSGFELELERKAESV